jgi:membrane fusion protein (multidrug efflux system)
MARTTETEVVDLEKTVRPREVEEHDSSEKTSSEKPESGRRVSSRKLSRWMLLLASIIAVAGASLWWVYSQNYESTDDAQIEGHLDLVNARISGTVTYINPGVENNQFVETGTLLMELDPRDYAAELEHAKANLDTGSAEARLAFNS